MNAIHYIDFKNGCNTLSTTANCSYKTATLLKPCQKTFKIAGLEMYKPDF